MEGQREKEEQQLKSLEYLATEQDFLHPLGPGIGKKVQSRLEKGDGGKTLAWQGNGVHGRVCSGKGGGPGEGTPWSRGRQFLEHAWKNQLGSLLVSLSFFIDNNE